ncbi:MAG: hypothetical protein ACRCX2_11760 [Paraclostridium sp.]
MLKLLVMIAITFLVSMCVFYKVSIYTCKNENSKNVLRIKLNRRCNII